MKYNRAKKKTVSHRLCICLESKSKLEWDEQTWQTKASATFKKSLPARWACDKDDGSDGGDDDGDGGDDGDGDDEEDNGDQENICFPLCCCFPSRCNCVCPVKSKVT